MRLLLAEDEEAMAEAVVDYLEYHHYEVDWVNNGTDALERARMGTYDVLILDIMMPGMDGLTVLRTLRGEGDVTPVLLLTAKGEIRDKVQGFESGSDDYLTKPFAMEELLARLRSLIRRGTPGAPDTVRLGEMTLDIRQGILKCVNSIALVGRETELLALLMRSTDREISEKEILSRIWRDFAGADGETLKLYVRYINGKLSSVGARFRVERRPGGMRLCREAEK